MSRRARKVIKAQRADERRVLCQWLRDTYGGSVAADIADTIEGKKTGTPPPPPVALSR